MAVDSERITEEESHGLQSESRSARALDERLAGDLRHDRLGGATSAAGYLRELGERPRLPVALTPYGLHSARRIRRKTTRKDPDAEASTVRRDDDPFAVTTTRTCSCA